MAKSKMAAKIEDGGQKFGVFSTRTFSLVIIYHHAKWDLCPTAYPIGPFQEL